jgi:hypothetical protein
MQKKPKSTQERPVPKIEAKEPFTTASAHTAVRNGFCIRPAKVVIHEVECQRVLVVF